MTRLTFAAVTLVVAAHAAAAQKPVAQKPVAQKPVAQKPVAQKPAAKTAAVQVAPSKKPAVEQAATPKAAATPAAKPQGATKLDLPSDSTASSVTIMREVFDYSSDGRRDPFVSLLNTSELRPGVNDLRLTGILYDQSGRHSVATLRDLGTNALYRVSVGTTLGRMHVAAIRLKTVVFSIDEFGTTRQDSLILGDTSKARPR